MNKDEFFNELQILLLNADYDSDSQEGVSELDDFMESELSDKQSVLWVSEFAEEILESKSEHLFNQLLRCLRHMEKNMNLLWIPLSGLLFGSLETNDLSVSTLENWEIKAMSPILDGYSKTIKEGWFRKYVRDVSDDLKAPS